MSTIPNLPSRSASPAGPDRRRTTLIAVVVVVLAALAWPAWRVWTASRAVRQTAAVFEAKRGPLTISVTVSGTIQNRDLVIVKSELEGRATLLKLVPEGGTVQKGDLLAELDSSSLVDQKTQQQITVMNAEAAFIRAQQNLDMTRASRRATSARRRSTSPSRRWTTRCTSRATTSSSCASPTPTSPSPGRSSSGPRTSSNGPCGWRRTSNITRTDLQADNLTARRCELNLQLAQTSGSCSKTTPTSAASRSCGATSSRPRPRSIASRPRRTPTGSRPRRTSRRRIRSSTVRRRGWKSSTSRSEVQDHRPVAGMVVYSTTGKMQWRGGSEPLAEGQEIRERQELIYLPTTKRR